MKKWFIMVLYYPPIDQLVENRIVFKNEVKNKTGMYFSPPKIGLYYSFTMNIYHLTFTSTPFISNHRKIPNSRSIERSTGYIGHRISYVLSKLDYIFCAIFCTLTIFFGRYFKNHMESYVEPTLKMVVF